MKKFPLYGWLGLSILVLAELFLLGENTFVATWFTPIMWTGYILLVDAIVCRTRGVSRLSSNPREIPFLLLVSVGVWLLFEAYNLHLRNWLYLGTPGEPLLRNIGFFWSFATIMPGVFVTIDLVQIILYGTDTRPMWDCTPVQAERINTSLVLIGLFMLITPIALPQHVAVFLFGLIWLGFIFVLEPINQRVGAQSLTPGSKSGRIRRLVVVLIAGLVCGFIWETWNFQAFISEGAYWVYTLPEPLKVFGWTYGMMPVLGLIGFPPFAWELLLIYGFIRKALGGSSRF